MTRNVPEITNNAVDSLNYFYEWSLTMRGILTNNVAGGN